MIVKNDPVVVSEVTEFMWVPASKEPTAYFYDLTRKWSSVDIMSAKLFRGMQRWVNLHAVKYLKKYG